MPGITFAFPLTDCIAPRSFTAHGRLDFTDVDTLSMNHRCTLTRNGVSTHANLFPRNDGVWTANFVDLAVGTGYTATAYYSSPTAGQVTVIAPETGIEITNQPAAVPLPPPYTPPPPPNPPAGAVGLAVPVGSGYPGPGSVTGPAVPPAGFGLPSVMSGSEILCGHPTIITVPGIYPVCLKFHKAIAIVRQHASPRRVASVLPVLTAHGTWTVLVPEPADYSAGVLYSITVVWLDRHGGQVTQTTRLL